MSDHYEELGVEPTAGKDEIRDAHRARLAELEAARGRKGVTEAQLQANREEAARVRGAWNVLSDPMQRQRYDQQLMDERAGTGDDAGTDVELVDDDSPAAPAPTGWRKLLAPPPAKDAGTKGAAGKAGAAGREPKSPARPQPSAAHDRAAGRHRARHQQGARHGPGVRPRDLHRARVHLLQLRPQPDPERVHRRRRPGRQGHGRARRPEQRERRTAVARRREVQRRQEVGPEGPHQRGRRI